MGRGEGVKTARDRETRRRAAGPDAPARPQMLARGAPRLTQDTADATRVRRSAPHLVTRGQGLRPDVHLRTRRPLGLGDSQDHVARPAP